MSFLERPFLVLNNSSCIGVKSGGFPNYQDNIHQTEDEENKSGDISVNLDDKVITIDMDLKDDEDEDEAYYKLYEKIEKLIMEKCIKIYYNIVKDKNYCVSVKVIG